MLPHFRRWARQASRFERARTAFVVAVAAVVVAAALLPAPAEQADDRLRAHGARTTDAGEVRTDSATTITGSSAPVVGAGPNPTATPPTRLGGGVAGPGRSGLTTGERGITTTSIKVGFTVVQDTLATALGYSAGFRKDARAAIAALVDYANDHGGVLGRRIEAAVVQPDFVNADDQRQKCIELTEGHGVFAAVDSIALGSPTAEACVTKEHRTLLLNGVPGSDENFRLGAPYHVSLHKDDNRAMKDLVAAAKANGFFDPAKGFRQLGVLHLDCDDAVLDDPSIGLFAHLRSAGIKEWVGFSMACDAAMARASARDAVNRFSDAGVTHVLLALAPPFLKEYSYAAGIQRFRPQHFTSDYAKVIMGGLADQYDISFDGALGVTQTHVGEGPVGKPLSPLAQQCSKILTDRGVAPISSRDAEDINDDLEILELCENFLLFLDVATRAGKNLTQASWLDALGQTGDFRGATIDLARFRPGKQSGGDTTKLVVWRANCNLGRGCWRDVTGFSPAAG